VVVVLPPSFPNMFGGGGHASEDLKNVKFLHQEGALQEELKEAGRKLVVVDFTASWCGPCKYIAPVYAELSAKYTNVVFLKIDVDELKSTAMALQIRAMPTFQFYLKGKKVDEFSGASPDQLKSMIEKHMTSGESISSTAPTTGQGYVLGSKPTTDTPSTTPTTTSTIPSNSSGSDGANIDQVFLATLMEMGFSQQKAQRALKATKGASVEAAMDWCFNHGDDPEPIPVPSATTTTSDMETEEKQGEPVEPKVLTPEEIEEQKRQIQEKIAQVREQRKKEEAQRDLDREKMRRQSGKETIEAHKQWEAKTREREAMLRKKEKEEEEKAREAIRKKN